MNPTGAAPTLPAKVPPSPELLKLQLGWIGTGVMGKSMCKHLLSQGYKLLVNSRTQSKTEDLIKEGAAFASKEEIAEKCDVVFLMLGFPQDVTEVLFDQGFLVKMKKGSYLVDHTTSSPNLAEKIQLAAQEKGIHAYDAPVSGGDIGARNGQLVTMCGGSEAEFKPVAEIMRTYSKNVQLMGKTGSGQHTKMMNQIVIAGSMVGVCESLVYGYSVGLDINKVLEVIGGGAASSYTLANLAPRVLKGDFNPGFYVEHFVKDMKIALEESHRMNIKLPGLELAHQLYTQLSNELGLGRCGTQALIKVLEHINKKQYTAPFKPIQ